MSQIKVTELTFCYEGSYDNIFEKTSFQIDTDWKLGFVGRNGRGKTTFLNLLLGKYEYQGNINSSVEFEYFPYEIKDNESKTLECIRHAIGDFEEWKFMAELDKLDINAEVLYRPFNTLSGGEKTKVMLAGLFIKENKFLLIDEPTNHLDMEGRESLAKYLNSKKSFILVSHDRAFLDRCIDHVLSINKNNIDIMKGNYSTWQYNKELRDNFELQQNENLKKDIKRLSLASERTAKWSDKVESEKIGTHVADRGYVGKLSAKAMKRSKNIERRRENAVEDKKSLLKNIEYAGSLKMHILDYPKKSLIIANNLSVNYGSKRIFENLQINICRGDRIAVRGKNGCGKSSLLKLLLDTPGPKISYVSQDTSFLKGNLSDFAYKSGIDYTLFLTILRQMDFPRIQFEKSIESYSMGQKKKVLIAKSLSESAHLYIWDEPLNYIDVISRIQIEEVILSYQPSMIFVEHDKIFCDRIATKEFFMK